MWEFDGTTFNQYLIPELPEDLLISDFHILEDESTLLGTIYKGVFLVKDSTVENWSSKNGLFSNRVRDIVKDDYDVYVITSGGINVFRDNNIQPLFKNGAINFSAIIKDSRGDYWAGAENDGLYRLKNDKWIKEFDRPGIYFNGLSENNNQEIWGSSNFGLFRIIVNSLGDVYVFNEINTLYTRSLLLDSEDGVWIGSYGKGIYHLTPNHFYNHTVESGFPSYFGKITYQDSKDRLWIHASTAGAILFDGNSFKFMNEQNGYPIRYLSSVAERRDSILLLLADNKIYRYVNDTFIEQIKTPPNARLVELYCDNSDVLWLSGIRSGVWKYKNNKWERFQLIPDNISVRYIMQDSHGNYWFSTFRDGAYKYDGKSITNYNETNGLTDNRANFILEDDQNKIWVATNDGICIYSNDKIIDTLNTADGLPGNIIYSLGKFNDFIFIGTADGLAIYNNGNIKFFTINDGMSSNDISDGYIPTINGKVWFGSTAGISAFLINKFLTKNYFSKAYISRIITDKDTINYNFLHPTNQLPENHFSSSMDFIHFDLSTISYSKEISSYRFKLDKAKNETDWTYSETKRITIENPKAGMYNLKIETNIFGDDWRSAYSIPLQISDPFYKTTSFLVIVLILFLTGSFCFYLFYNFNKEKNKYKTSSLNKEKISIIKNEIIDALEKKERFKNPHISLQELSYEINRPKEHISQIINSEFNKNFNDLINSYRIDEAKRLIEMNSKNNLSILQTAYEVGFNSKSSFNSAFKKHTGLTPTQFKNSLQIEIS